MSDDEEDGRRSPRRVTLKWERRLLALPGEETSRSASHTEALELALPSDELDAEPSAMPSASALANLGERDGWERQRPRVTPVPFRAPIAPPALALGQEPGSALELVEQRARPMTSTDLSVEMDDRYALGDYTGALQAAELILGREPENAAAAELAASSRQQLERLYRSRLGSMTQVPQAVVEGSAVRWLGLDPRAGFLLSRIDGEHNLAEVLDISGMSTLEALKTLAELLELRVIVLRPGRT